MRGILILLLMFGAVAVVFIRHWMSRAKEITRDAAEHYSSTGSIAETFRRLQGTYSGNAPLSEAQQVYLMANFDEFLRVYGAAVEQRAALHAQRWMERNRHKNPTREEIGAGVQASIFVAACEHGRLFCENAGVR